METLPRTLGDTPTGNRPMRAVVPAGGERAAVFARFVGEQQGRVARLASRLLGWSPDVDDVVQDVFTRVWNAMPDFRGDAEPATWLTRITINACRSHRRRRVLWRRFWERETAGSASVADGAAARSSDRVSTGDDETLAAVREAIAELPARDREVIVLRYLEELPANDVAAILNISRNAVDVRLNRARARLRTVLADWMELP